MKRSAFLCSVVIFAIYREVPTCTILPNFIGHCRDSIVFAFWWRRRQKREKEETYVRQVLNCFNSTRLEFPWPTRQFPWPTRIILQGNQKWSLRAGTCVRYNYYVQLVATKRDWMRVPNVKSRSARQRHAIDCRSYIYTFSRQSLNFALSLA